MARAADKNTSQNDSTADKNPTLRLFNDVYSSRWGHTPVYDATWVPFSWLPSELRSQIWLHHLQQHRMIELNVIPPDDEDPWSDLGKLSCPHYYKNHNHLGKIISGRGYRLRIEGRGSYAASLNPLLWVNREARHTALRFYHICLPLRYPHGEPVLYLNSEYDVICIRHQYYDYETYVWHIPPRLATILIDVLHDTKAYDYKDQGSDEDNDNEDGVDSGVARIHFYICPTVCWDERRLTGIFEDGEQSEEEEEGPREQRAKFLESEANTKSCIMAKGTYTAVGMWLFPVDGFQKCTDARKYCFDVPGVRPELFLFDV
ncbi:hypothetical protein VTH82DRAFT_6171 [Thermothelomyces myriococcoides]